MVPVSTSPGFPCLRAIVDTSLHHLPRTMNEDAGQT